MFEWAWVDAALDYLVNTAKILPIIDWMHYGTPLWLDGQFAHADYPRHVEEYARRFAERYGDRVTDYTPVNEPMIHALFCGVYGYWPPYLTGDTGLTTMVRALGEGFVRTQRGIAEVLGDRSTFMHVDASMRYAGDVRGERRRVVRLGVEPPADLGQTEARAAQQQDALQPDECPVVVAAESAVADGGGRQQSEGVVVAERATRHPGGSRNVGDAVGRFRSCGGVV